MEKTVVISSPNATAETSAERNVWTSIKRGWRGRCPSCGDGAMYGKFLKVAHSCPTCGTELHHQRADDAPPYFVMTITAHVVVAGILILEKNYTLDPMLQMAIWTPVVVLLSLWLLPRVKGALIGYQWALGMHGFSDLQVEGADLPPTDPTPST